MKEKGYLQIELLVVITIITLFMMVPTIKPAIIDQIVFESEARMLASDLRWLQQYSMNIARGSISFDEVQGDLVPKMYFMIGPNGKYSILEGPNTIKIHYFSRAIGVSGNYAPISFSREGYINKPITIVLYQGNNQKKIIIDRVGRIRVQ